MAVTRIGISGWRYAPWRGVFYPKGLRQRDELTFAADHFPSIEINGSFYALQRPTSYQQWYAQTPEDFVFSLKGPRFITHLLRLNHIETALANFFASGVLELREKLGPILWQFPPNFIYDEARFEAFFKQLPRRSSQAAALAKQHDAKLKHGSHTAVDRDRSLRHAVEIRHASFLCDTFITQLRRHGIALVVADTAQRWPLLEDVTADFMYIRLHGDAELYASGYGETALKDWARRISAWQRGSQPRGARRASTLAPTKATSRDVYCYFDNDMKVHAPDDALRLRHLVRRR